MELIKANTDLFLEKTSTAYYRVDQWLNCHRSGVSYKYNYKSATTSIFRLFQKYGHWPEENMSDNRTKWPDYRRTFTCFRNPFHRSLSIYKEMRDRGQLIRDQIRTYEQYLENILIQGFTDKHQFSQMFWIGPHLDDINFKIIAMAGDWTARVLDILDLSGTVKVFPHANKRATRPDDIVTPYCESMVRDIYRADVDFWINTLNQPL